MHTQCKRPTLNFGHQEAKYAQKSDFSSTNLFRLCSGSSASYSLPLCDADIQIDRDHRAGADSQCQLRVTGQGEFSHDPARVLYDNFFIAKDHRS